MPVDGAPITPTVGRHLSFIIFLPALRKVAWKFAHQTSSEFHLKPDSGWPRELPPTWYPFYKLCVYFLLFNCVISTPIGVFGSPKNGLRTALDPQKTKSMERVKLGKPNVSMQYKVQISFLSLLVEFLDVHYLSTLANVRIKLTQHRILPVRHTWDRQFPTIACSYEYICIKWVSIRWYGLVSIASQTYLYRNISQRYQLSTQT
jgi:hypothetical protein